SVLIFCDDDNWLHQDYIQTSFEIVNANSSIGALGGMGIATSDQDLPSWFDEHAHCYACFRQGERDGELGSPLSTLFGAGLVVRKEVFNSLKKLGFKPILSDRIENKLSSGGDTELSYAIRLLGLKLMYSGKLSFQHYITPSRLSYTYLYGLVASLSYCSGDLIMYRYILSNREISSVTWLKDFSYQLIFLFQSLANYLNVKTPMYQRRLDLIFTFYRLKSIMFQFRKYKKRYRTIINLRKSKDVG
ncbi:MAG: hypothetical protein HC811_10250, partial [Flammeovirgaceae bacterium]|nr:hypothetical protein [Flammeovirgaceae bacterium]